MARKKKDPNREKTSWYNILLIFIDICALVCFFGVYGPVDYIRDWYVTTAMTTGAHKYLAYIFYNEQTVDDVLDKNRTIQVADSTDTSMIHFSENPDVGYYENEYERRVLEKEYPEQDYKLVAIDEFGYSGFITVIYNPANLDLVRSKYSYGELMTEYADRYDAKVATNGGGFYSADEAGNLYPLANLISDGKIVNNNGSYSNFIGMTYDNVLVLTRCTAYEAIRMGMRWATAWTPYLIVNGVKSSFIGNGGYGLQPRTAIGQRADGVIIIATIDGRGANGSSGAYMSELADLMERYGCINAANLDGGGSAMLVVDGELKNHPAGWNYTGERYVGEALIYH